MYAAEGSERAFNGSKNYKLKAVMEIIYKCYYKNIQRPSARVGHNKPDIFIKKKIMCKE